MATNYDWANLPYYGLMANLGLPGGFDSGSGFDPSAPTYANVALPGYQQSGGTPDYSFQDTFGGHSGLTQNPDGTFTAKRRVEGSPDSTAYETTQFKVSDDGKSLVPVDGKWSPITIKDTGFFESIGNAISDFGGVLGDALPTLAVPIAASFLYPALAGGSAGAAGGVAAGDAAAGGLLDLGGGMASGIPAWDAAAAAAGIPLEYAAPPLLSGINTAATNPALIESAVGTPGYGASSAGAGGGAGVLTGATAGMSPGTSGVPVGGATPVVPNPNTSSGSGLLGGVGDFLLKNPQLAGAVLGGLLGGMGGAGGSGYKYDGPMPTIKRDGWKPSVEAKSQPVQNFGLLAGQGQPNAGLWRFLK